MNPHTGHLVALREDEAMPAGYEALVEKRLAMAARMKLAGQPEAQVNLRSRTPLAQWAKQKRKAKIAAKSRRRNRRG